MTNKEAINIIQEIEVAPEHLEALTLAIKALEERPQGKWLTHQTGYLLWEECDQCRAQVGTVGMNFCPNCGADMRGTKGTNDVDQEV